MQLISLFLFLCSAVALGGAIVFVALWHCTHRDTPLARPLREGVGHIGISTIVTYPATLAPLYALLEEEYPRSEAIIIADLQQSDSLIGKLVHRYRLIRVNCSHLLYPRALYRSRHRAFRRVVVVDLPIEHQDRATAIGKEVASYDYVLQLQGESIVTRNAVAYCANIIASHCATTAISLRSIVGCEARLERSDMPDQQKTLTLFSDRAIAWRRCNFSAAMLAICLPAVMVLVAHFGSSMLAFMAAVAVVMTEMLLLYLSCRLTTEKSLVVRLNMVLQNLCRFITNRVIIRAVSRIRDTLRHFSWAQAQNRPAHCRADARPKRQHPSRPRP